MPIFEVGNTLPSVKQVTLVRKYDGGSEYEILADYKDEAVTLRDYPAGCGKSIGKWKIMGITKFPEQECATIKLKVRMDTSGLMRFVSSFVMVV